MSSFVHGLLGRLFGLETGDGLDFGATGVEFGFEHALPAWAWSLVVLGAVALAVLGYRRLEGSRLVRSVLGGLRALAIIVLALLLSGPRLIKPNESIEKDWVMVLVDRSASMSVPDAPSATPDLQGGGPVITREGQLEAALALASPSLVAMAKERVVVWMGFDSSAFELGVDQQTGMPRLGSAGGRRTDIGQALEQSLKRASARPLAGVVILSDGRSVSAPTKQFMRRLEAEKVPVFSIALGSAEAMADVAVRRAEAPRSAFVSDIVPVEVELERTPAVLAGGAAGGGVSGAQTSSIVELFDPATGQVLDTQTLDWAVEVGSGAGGTGGGAGDPKVSSATRRVTLTSRPSVAGEVRWQVRVRSGAAGQRDMIPENDTAEVPVELVDRPLRVAYFEGYPRWEYRYLKNLLVRERSISSVVMLLAPGRRYLQEGTVVLDSLPRTREDWEKYDLIILGDVTPSVFTQGQLAQMKARITEGAGLIWIGGEQSTPTAWRTTPMGDLLPMMLSSTQASGGSGEGRVGLGVRVGSGGGVGSGVGGGGIESFGGPVTMLATPAAERLGVLRMADASVAGSWWSSMLSDPATGWSQLYWAQRLDRRQLKPTAEVLAVAIEPGGSLSPEVMNEQARSGPALVTAMRFGAGRVVYVATDEIWRWRYGRGETLTERFWLQFIRLLGRESLSRSGRPVLIEATPERAEPLQAVRVSVTLLDQALAQNPPASVLVRVAQQGSPSGSLGSEGGGQVGAEGGSVELKLTPEASVSSEGGASRVYSGTWIAGQPGRYRAEVLESAIVSAANVGSGERASGGGGIGQRSLETGIEVSLADDELRQPQTDHPLLARLSEETGGQVLETGQLGEVSKLVPNRQVRVSGEPEIRTLWDTPVALLVLIVLLGLEWIGRRLLRLA